MFAKKDIPQILIARIAPVVVQPPSATETPANPDALSQDELRRQMYERIAQGNALAETEDYARQLWKGR